MSAEFPTADPAVTCQEWVPDPENGPDLCTAMSRYVVERSDGDRSFGHDGKHESCEAHLAGVVTDMVAGFADVRAVVTIRWDADGPSDPGLPFSEDLQSDPEMDYPDVELPEVPADANALGWSYDAASCAAREGSRP
jgi:hypothetical protein